MAVTMEKVSLLNVPSYRENLILSLAELLKPLGGWESFCKPGDRVLLKPNLVMAKSPESAALTHPALILSVASLLKDLGCRVAVGDSPGLGSAESVIRKLGIDRELKKLDVKVVEFEAKVGCDRFPAANRFEKRFKNLELAGELLEYDRLINLAKLKSHGQMGVTLATKNLFGCVVGHNKGRWHFAAGRDLHAFARLLVEIALTVNASLHIVDGITGMDGNGPTSGRPREIGLLLAGTNPIALDRVVVEIIGRRPEQFPLFVAAREMGLAGLDMEEIELLGAGIKQCLIPDFEIPALVPIRVFMNPVVSGLLERFVRQRLTLDPVKCIHCRKCEQLCPAQAIHYSERIRIDDRKCIRCCCCQELCPAGALTVSESGGVKIMRLLKLI
jgi:uncharacterized protein (DUF362 family)/NAD-dependent dihydropyrimidine dehydrogenase PreA subunit